MIDKLREKLKHHVAEHSSEEGKEEIEGTDHVYEIWEDGELTSTKGGRLFRKRSLHRIQFPFLDEDIWEVPEDQDHKSMVVVDRTALEVLEEFREKIQ